jgi:hypothetical protein
MFAQGPHPDDDRTHPRLCSDPFHPDETAYEEPETVQAWVEEHAVNVLDNAIFVAPKEYLSSYELIQRSKFVMVYNSTMEEA